MKKLVIFDLDNTLTESKSDLSTEMEAVLSELAKKTKIAVMSGCNWDQMCDQFFCLLKSFDFRSLWNVYMLPSSGGQLWSWEGPEEGCVCHYSNDLTLREKAKIYREFENICWYRLASYKYEYGEIAEDRRSQITFSLLGQNAPLGKKKLYDPDLSKRKEIVWYMQSALQNFDIRIGGTTSIDVTKKGINKAYGITKLIDHIQQQDIRCLEHEYDCGEFEGMPICCNQNLKIEDAVYVGDALFEGGNDEIVKTTGIDTIETKSPANTIEIIKSLL